MSQTSVDFINIFVQPPGDLLFFLGVAAIILAAFFMVLGQRLRVSRDSVSGRYVVATLGTLIAWASLIGGALFALLSGRDAVLIMPPLERAVTLITVLLLGWAFLTANQAGSIRVANIVLLLLLAVALLGYILSGSEWAGAASDTSFNASVYGVGWTVATLIVCGLGVALLIAFFRRVVDAPLKIVFFVVLLAGLGYTLFQTVQGDMVGDYAGATRIAYFAASAILPAVIYRMVLGDLESTQEIDATNRPDYELGVPVARRPKTGQTGRLEEVASRLQTEPTSAERAVSPLERESVKLLKVLGLILEEPTPQSIPLRVVKATVEVLKADVGALLRLQDSNYADTLAGYNQVMDRELTGMSLNLSNQPTLVNAIDRQKQRTLYTDRNVEELQDLYTRLDVEASGPAYFQPLIADGEVLAVLVLGLPYSDREFESYERELLRSISIMAGRLLKLSFEAANARVMAEERAIQAVIEGVNPEDLEEESIIAARQEMQASLEYARSQITELSQQVTQLKIELDAERSRVTDALNDTEGGLSISQRIITMNEEQQRLRSERDDIAAQLQDAEAALAGATATDDESVFNAIVEVLRREKEELINQRESLREQIAMLRAAGNVPLPQIVRDVLERMGEEKARLEFDREQLKERLEGIEVQFESLGIEDGAAGLAKMVSQLYEQRAALKARNEVLLTEREALDKRLQAEQEREHQFQALQNEVQNLAADREAAVKQRDKLRNERDELAAREDTLKRQRARLVAHVSAYQEELQETQTETSELRQEMQKLSDRYSELNARYEKLRAEKQTLETERDQLLARSEGDRERLQQLGEDGIGSLKGMIEELSGEKQELEQELNATRTRLKLLEHQLEVRKLEDGSSLEVPLNGSTEAILSAMHELRTPMTSIIGYVELLLRESAGILGEMQRKFLQRVAANVTRLATMIDDVIRVMTLESGNFSLVPELVDVVGLIEDAITNATTQFREKGMTVHLDLDLEAPPMPLDRDSMVQVVNQLLTNAYLVSPSNSEMFIAARREKAYIPEDAEQPIDSLIVSIEDRGGGIAPEDRERVFNRKYKAQHPLIQGLGETGVGLTLAKALVEAHGGRMWLESREGVGTTFYFALPFEQSSELEG